MCVQLGQKGEKFLLDPLVMMMLFYYLVQRLLSGPCRRKNINQISDRAAIKYFLGGNAGNRWIFPPFCFEFMFYVPF